jgi:TRAP-type C4-dicarboxylate transport system permease small subunit
VTKVVKVLLVVAFLAAAAWLGLRIWKKRANTH